MNAKKKLKARTTALKDQVQAELESLTTMANGVAEWAKTGAVLQVKVGQAIERVAEQQKQLELLEEEYERGF